MKHAAIIAQGGNRKAMKKNVKPKSRRKPSGFVKSLVLSPLGSDPERDARIRERWSQQKD
jgi:hypothetical protein